MPGDSSDYHIISEGVKVSSGVLGMACEIGLRRGGGTKTIIDALVESGQAHKTVIAIDPYGDIEMAWTDGQARRFDYTNEMRNECLSSLYAYASGKVNFIFFCMEDQEFFDRFSAGIPVYKQSKVIESQYSFVHFDGPHSCDAIRREVEFFHARAVNGAVFVFDDVGLYNHSDIDTLLLSLGWRNLDKSPRKWSYTNRR